MLAPQIIEREVDTENWQKVMKSHRKSFNYASRWILQFLNLTSLHLKYITSGDFKMIESLEVGAAIDLVHVNYTGIPLKIKE